MRADIELRLGHDGRCWVVDHEQFSARGETFPELDEAVARQLRARGGFPPGQKLCVYMGFDFDAFPKWLHQYHTHYFNRYVDLVI